MPKLYADCSKRMNELKPKKETIDFLLNYSKALHVIKLNKVNVELLQN